MECCDRSGGQAEVSEGGTAYCHGTAFPGTGEKRCKSATAEPASHKPLHWLTADAAALQGRGVVAAWGTPRGRTCCALCSCGLLGSRTQLSAVTLRFKPKGPTDAEICLAAWLCCCYVYIIREACEFSWTFQVTSMIDVTCQVKSSFKSVPSRVRRPPACAGEQWSTVHYTTPDMYAVSLLNNCNRPPSRRRCPHVRA